MFLDPLSNWFKRLATRKLIYNLIAPNPVELLSTGNIRVLLVWKYFKTWVFAGVFFIIF